MTIHKTFTIGQVWTEFVKRLPRTQPRYRHDPSDKGAIPDWIWRNAFQAMSKEQTDAMAAQNMAASSNFINSGGYWRTL